MAVQPYYTTGFMGHTHTVNCTIHEQFKALTVQVWSHIYNTCIHCMYRYGGHPYTVRWMTGRKLFKYINYVLMSIGIGFPGVILNFIPGTQQWGIWELFHRQNSQNSGQKEVKLMILISISGCHTLISAAS